MVTLDTIRQDAASFVGAEYKVGTQPEQGAASDFLQSLISSYFQGKYGATKGKSRRSIDDFSVGKFIVDVKTHRLDSTTFYQPNMISADRLHKLYASKEKTLVYIFVDYVIVHDSVSIRRVETRPIESINWSCLSIQAQGLGVIQLKNNISPIAEWGGDRSSWLVEFQSHYIGYIDKQIDKLKRRRTMLENQRSISETVSTE